MFPVQNTCRELSILSYAGKWYIFSNLVYYKIKTSYIYDGQ